MGTWTVRTLAIHGVNGAAGANIMITGLEVDDGIILRRETKDPGCTMPPTAGYNTFTRARSAAAGTELGPW